MELGAASLVYDTGALLAAEADDRRMWLIHHDALARHREVLVPAVVVTQAWRGGPRQARLARFLNGCTIVGVGDPLARAAGVLCGRAGTADAVDAIVVAAAVARGAIVVTSDPGDLATLADAAGTPVPLLTV